jgi:acylphosphatase
MAGSRVALLLAVVLANGPALLIADAAGAQPQAISATVSGNVQKVGFRAMILKEAIKYNLAGSARNDPDGTVRFSLQGDRDRIDQALDTIRDGTKKSSNVKVSAPSADPWNPNLKTFTVIDWTSTSRNITNPYTLVFTLRPANDKISHHEAKNVFNEIAEKTLKGDDLRKFKSKLEDDD